MYSRPTSRMWGVLGSSIDSQIYNWLTDKLLPSRGHGDVIKNAWVIMDSYSPAHLLNRHRRWWKQWQRHLKWPLREQRRWENKDRYGRFVLHEWLVLAAECWKKGKKKIDTQVLILGWAIFTCLHLDPKQLCVGRLPHIVFSWMWITLIRWRFTVNLRPFWVVLQLVIHDIIP